MEKHHSIDHPKIHEKTNASSH